jgi:hypothetical protein
VKESFLQVFHDHSPHANCAGVDSAHEYLITRQLQLDKDDEDDVNKN